MSVEDRYIHNVLRRVWVPEERRAGLEADLRDHFARARQAGEAPTSVTARLGDPAEVAAELMAGVELPYAGFWRRTFAFLADMGILIGSALPLLLIPTFLIAAIDAMDGSAEVSFASLFVVAGFVLVGLAYTGVGLLYFPVLEKRFGKTPGKHLLGLRVRDEDGGEISWGQAFLRRLSLYFEFLVLDALFVPFTEKKQRAFDLVSDTVVLREHEDRRGPGSALALGLLIVLAFSPLLLAVLIITGVTGASLLGG